LPEGRVVSLQDALRNQEAEGGMVSFIPTKRGLGPD